MTTKLALVFIVTLMPAGTTAAQEHVSERPVTQKRSGHSNRERSTRGHTDGFKRT